MRLYKYVTAERIADLLAGSIRFTQPGAFNDPFEMPAFKKRQAERLLAGLLAQTTDILAQATANPTSPPPAAFILPMFYWQAPRGPEIADAEAARKVIEKLDSIDKRFGVLSLTGAPDNLLMWAHYADEHKGAVIEIDIEHPEFTAGLPGKDGFQQARAVRYTLLRPKLPLSDEVLMDHFFTNYVPRRTMPRRFNLHTKVDSNDET